MKAINSLGKAGFLAELCCQHCLSGGGGCGGGMPGFGYPLIGGERMLGQMMTRGLPLSLYYEEFQKGKCERRRL